MFETIEDLLAEYDCVGVVLDSGRKQPNGFVNWLDVQARALYQAYRLIVELIKKEG